VKTFDKAFKKLFEDTFILYEFIKMFLPALVDEYGVNKAERLQIPAGDIDSLLHRRRKIDTSEGYK